MDAKMTVSVRGILVAAVVVLALLVAYLLGGAGGGGTPAQAVDEDQANDVEAARTLTMTGTGEATAVPDQMSFGIGVTVVRPDLETALADASATMNRVLAALADQGVEKSDVRTTGLGMNAVYAYHDNEPPTITGYRVNQRANVLVTELKRGGAAVTAAVDAGGNDVRVGGIKLLVGDTDAVMQQARDAAVAEATAKAEQYAAASGQELDEVLTLREVHAKPVPTPTYAYRAALKATDTAAPMPIRAGEERGAVTVRIVWNLQ
jgi:uncharacterized protein YggE